MIHESSLAVPKRTRLRPVILTSTAMRRFFLSLLVLAAIWVGLAPLAVVPAVVPATASAAEFSAERAMRDLAFVAAAPHPTGSPRNAAVREYLVGQIRALGLTPEVQRATLTRWARHPGIAEVMTVENILVRVPGTDTSRAIMVEGHYDTVPTTAGATDCGSCTVTALEALRAIVAGPPLKNDVIFLFADGEEVFIAGAQTFMQQHPWAKDVGLTLVFEGYGTDGASMLYATSSDSGWWVDQALRAAPHALGFSFLNDLMWNLAGNSGSDLDAYITDGQAGLAFIYLSLRSAPAYHTLADSIQNLDPRSLQHHGSYAVSLVRHFGNLRLDIPPRVVNAIYFPIFPGVVVHYPGSWAQPLAFLALCLFAVVVVLGVRRRRLSIGGILAGVIAFLINLVAAVALVTLVWSLIRRANMDLHGFSAGGWYGGVFYLLAFLALTLAAVAALYVLWRRWVGLDGLLVGALAWWMLLALLTGLGLPGFSYLFTWPLLTALALLGWSYAQPEVTQRPWARVIILALPAVISLVLLSAVIELLFFFAARMEGIMGVPLAALPMPLAVLLIGLLLPQLEFLAPARRQWLPFGAGAAFLAFLLIATTQFPFDAQHPQANTVVYWMDAERGQAKWITVNDSPTGQAHLDGWTQQFFPNGAKPTTFQPWLNGWQDRAYPALEAAAPVVAMPTSSVTMLSDTTNGGARQLRMRISPPEDVLNSQVVVQASGPIVALTANGSALDMQKQTLESVQINVIGRQTDGVTLDLTVAAAGPVSVTLQDRRLGIPEIPGVAIAPRPDWMMPAPLNDVADSTIVRQTFRF
jgi:hypothetical protein